MIKTRYTAFILCTALVFMLLCGCGNRNDESITDPAETDYTVTVQTAGGMPVTNVRVCIYEADDREDLVWAADTDKEGRVTFKGDLSEKVAVIDGIPRGYSADEAYTVTEENTVISLTAALLTGDDLNGAEFALGDVFGDFTVKSFDGTEYSISQLLSEKKAVVLNFWFINCGPCKMEFPYMQAAYEDFSDEIEILAINPYDGTDETVEAYANDLSLTFPVASCGAEWQTAMSLTAYPTTVVIDRYGMVAMYHRGAVPDKETFVKIFEYFTADDYKQSAIRNISDIK